MAKAKTNIKQRVITFRITGKQEADLKQHLDKNKIFGMNSENQLCRKIVCDYLRKKLVYTEPGDVLVDTDSLTAGTGTT